MRNASRNANELIRALGLTKDNQEHPSNMVFKTGTIPAGYSGTGWPTIQFDGESTVGSRQYPYLSSYTPVVGDRVILAMLANSGIVLGKIGGQPTGSTAPGGIATFNALSMIDTRNASTTPSTYGSEFATNFKTATAVGLPASAGTYAAVTAVAPWTDDSGGGNFEIAYTSSGTVYMRYGTRANGWSGWILLFQPSGATIQSITWQTPTYLNTWSAWGDPNFRDGSYYKDGTGIVRLEGLVRSPTTAGSAGPFFQLPSGYRPSKNLIFPISDGEGAYKDVRVESGGNVSLHTSAAAASQYYSLSGISFLAEQ